MAELTRRQLLAGMACLSFTTVAAVACTAKPDSSQGDKQAEADASRSGQGDPSVLRVGALGKAASAERDPYKMLVNDSDMLICSLIWEPFTVPGEHETVAPRLMEKWEQTSPTQWRFTIAEGATFHDGSKVTSEDVVWSMDKLLANEANASRLPVIPDSITAVDERTVEMETPSPNSQLPMLARLMTFVMKKDSSYEEPIGSGPFTLVKWDNGSATLKRFKDYHGTVAGVEEIQVIPFDDPTALTNAILAGQIDYAQAVGPVAARSAEGRSGVEVFRRSNDYVIPLVMRCSDGPFADPKVREAVRLGVDRDGVIKRALSGYGTAANDVLGTGDPNLDHTLVRTRDVNKAKRLLSEADFDLGATYDLFVTPEAPGQLETAKVVAEQLGDIGININVVEQDSGQFYEETWKQADLFLTYWGTNDSTLFFAGKVLVSDASANESNFDDPEFNQIYAELLSSNDQDTIDELSVKLQKIQFDRGGYVVWGAADGVDLAVTGVQGLPKAPGYGRVLLETVTRS